MGAGPTKPKPTSRASTLVKTKPSLFASKDVVTKPKAAVKAAPAPVLRSSKDYGNFRAGGDPVVWGEQQGQNEDNWAALLNPAPKPPSGSGTGANDAATNAINSLFADFNQPSDNSLFDKLNGFTSQAQTTGNTAISDLQSMLAGQTNPYQHLQQATQNTNPMAEYMRATGASTAQTDALMAMLNGQATDRVAAGNQLQDQQGQSWDAAQQGRKADAATSGAAFNQSLAASNASAQSQITTQDKARKDALKKQILELSLTHGVDLKKLGVSL